MVTEAPAAKLERALDDFDPTVRAQALAVLASLAERGEIPLAPTTPVANMHCHTFFGFNAYGHSPSSIAWHAKRRGYQLMGKLDFDVLDGVEELKVKVQAEVPHRWQKELDGIARELDVKKLELYRFILGEFLGKVRRKNAT